MKTSCLLLTDGQTLKKFIVCIVYIHNFWKLKKFAQFPELCECKVVFSVLRKKKYILSPTNTTPTKQNILQEYGILISSFSANISASQNMLQR